MIRLTEFSLKQKSVVILLAIGIFVAGAISWVNLKQELIPDIELPFVMVITPMPGAGAEDVAMQVTDPIERSLVNVPRLEGTQSTSSNSMSLVFAEFDFGTDVKEATAEVERAVDSIQLPESAEPIVNSFGIDDLPVVTATIGAPEGGDPDRAARIARTEILPQLQGLEGVSSADLTGGTTPVLDIVLDPARMAEHGISLQQIQGILIANQITLPSGSIDEGDLRLPVSTQHHYTSAAELAGQIVGASSTSEAATPNAAAEGAAVDDGAATTDDEGGLFGSLPDLGRLTEALASIPVPVRLGDVATIEPRDANLSGYARTDGQPSLTVSVSLASGANTVSVSNEIEAVFEAARQAYPAEIII
ncbi:MAG TPA: efflux RND transporter permease subunit, partial [Anaerolineae bacterium]|nr:efflux RND transporter permease subunit [Anaerolineae bacterium]